MYSGDKGDSHVQELIAPNTRNGDMVQPNLVRLVKENDDGSPDNPAADVQYYEIQSQMKLLTKIKSCFLRMRDSILLTFQMRE